MEIPKEKLKEIAEELEAGFACFIHKDTLELVTYMDPDRHPDIDEDLWKGEMKKVKKNKKQFIEIENMESRDSFRVMEDFVNSLENCTTKIRLLTALEGQKPFANFKHQLDNSGDHRQQWFAFRTEKMIEWVQNQLNIDRL